MSDSPANSPRPVALITVVFLFALVGVGFWVVSHYYQAAPASAVNTAAENLTKDLEWKATPKTRQETLAALRKSEADRAQTYAWVDKDKKVVQLPIERAMQLTAEKYGSKK